MSDNIWQSVLSDDIWAIHGPALHAMRALFEQQPTGSGIDIEARTEPRGASALSGGVAIIPIHGVISQRLTLMAALFGAGLSTEQLTAELRAAVADASIRAIVLDIDSPGGSVYGIPELAAEIARARGQKPVLAVANSMMASAAYWLGSQATELAVTPGGEVGSIGVIAEHVDISGLEAKAGVRTTLVTAGAHKGEGSPYEPLSDTAREHLQARVNQYYEMFVGAVAQGRGVSPASVREGMGQGRMVGAAEAVSLGMVDRVATLEQVIARAARGRLQPGTRADGECPAILAEASESEVTAFDPVVRRRRDQCLRLRAL